MTKFLSVIGLLVLTAAPSVSFCADKAPLSTVETMAGEIVKHFPRAEGRVTYAEGDKVRFDIGANDGLKAGMEIFLFRPGKPIRHPVTKVILGSREEPLGKAVLTDVKDRESEGRVTELKVTLIIAGDVGRLSTDKDKLVLAVCGKDYNERVLDKLTGALRDSGRFDIAGPVEAPSALDAEAAKKVVSDNSAQDLVVLKTMPTTKPDKTSVEVTLYSKDGEAVEHQAGLVDITSEVFGEKVMDYPLVRGEHRDFYHVENLPYRAKHMAAGNITGEGKTELAVSDGRSIIVYRFEGEVLSELWREEGESSNDHLDVECADLDGNGRDEIYVTNFAGGAMSSYVLEYDGHGFRYISKDQPLFFRVMDVPGSGRKLITSTIGTDAPYSGVIREYRWEGGGLKPGEALPLPSRIKDPYGFVLMDLMPDKDKAGKADAGKRPFDGLEIVWVDDSDYLQVLNMKGKRLWKSKERYGGYDNFFELDKKRFTLPNVDNRGKVKGRLILRDDPDGGKEIVLTKNIAMTNIVRRLKGYSGAEVYSLAWDGGDMVTRWSLKNIDGYLADIYIGDPSNSGRESVLLLTAPTFKLAKSSKKAPLGSLSSLKDTFADRASLLLYRVPQR